MLRNHFDRSQSTNTDSIESVALPELSNFIVNYVWINEQIFMIPPNDPNAPVCGIPLHYIDQAIGNAQRYPYTKFQIWIDPRFLDDTPSLFFLQSYLYDTNSYSNITIRDLNEIDAYKNDPDNFFDPDQKNSIWARVDLARLLVLRQTLDERENGDIIALYSDFDIHDIFKESDFLKSAIAIHGFAIGGVLNPETEEYHSIENGFLAFAYHGEIQHILDVCLPEKSLVSSNDRDSIYGAFLTALDEIFEQKDINRENVVVPEILRPNFYKIKKPPYWENICI